MKQILVFSLYLLSMISQQPALAEPIPEAEISDAQESFYELQPYFAASQAERQAVRHFGIETTAINGDYVISAVLDGFPAQAAKLRRGDRLISVNTVPFAETLPFGTGSLQLATDSVTPQVTLNIDRNDQNFTVELPLINESLYDSRRAASVASVQKFSAGNKTIAYFHPWSLSRNLNDLRSFLRVMSGLARTDGLILDLRDSYGFLSIHHIDAFFPTRHTLIAISGQGNLHTDIQADEPPLQTDHYGRPIAVLINAETAGGAELLAFQLAQLERVTTVGEASAGNLGIYHLSNGVQSRSLQYQPLTNTEINSIPASKFRVLPELEIDYPLTQSTRTDPQFEAAYNALLGYL